MNEKAKKCSKLYLKERSRMICCPKTSRATRFGSKEPNKGLFSEDSRAMGRMINVSLGTEQGCQ